ncbi:MAG: hypothetical protein Q9217_000666 [Psora testacea]
MDISTHSTQLIHELRKLQSRPDDLLDILQRSPTSKYLDTLAELALDPSYTFHVYATHEKIFVEISSRWLASAPTDGLPALIAYARILPSAPHLIEHATALLQQRRPGTLEALTSQDVTSLQNLSDDHLHNILLALCRLLIFDNTRFASWTSPAKVQMLLSHHRRHIRYLAIRILCLYLHASDAVLESMVKINLGGNEVDGPWDEKTIDYTFLSLWERRRFKELEQYVQRIRKQYEDWSGSMAFTPFTRTLRAEDLSSTTAYMGDVLVPCTTPPQQIGSTVVPIRTTVENLTKLGQGINSGRPLMVSGLPGVGKTKLIREVARTAGKDSSMVTLHLNDQTDAKLLIGLYTSSQTPGSFSWRPGVLTTALLEGRWVLIEDFDRAPMEVISILLPVIERGELLIPSSGEFIRAAPGFKLIATIRSNRDTRGEAAKCAASMNDQRRWFQVRLHMPSDAELSEIIAYLYPLVSPHLPRMMRVYIALANQSRVLSPLPRPIGPQEFLRWSRRVHSLLYAAGVTSDTEPISDATNDDIFLEAVDCFAGPLPVCSARAQIVDVIAQELHLPAKRAEHALEARKPAYIKSDSSLRIGRAINRTVNGYSKHISAKCNASDAFATTDHVLRTLESVALTVQQAEPCLLVGETGTGKTTIVQQLAIALGHNLTVVNLSQQSEAGDLLGGYKPVNLRNLAVPIKEELDDLLQLTIPSQENRKFRDIMAKAVARGQWTRVLTLWEEALRTIEPSLLAISPTHNLSNKEPRQKKRRLELRYQGLYDRWVKFAADVKTFQMHLSSGSKGFAFSFVEGNIVKAARNGDWVLLDEINLASSDTLENLVDLFSHDPDNGPSLLLAESGDVDRISAHKDFRIFGAMNPATDIGKRDLPPSIRSKFTEISIDAPDKSLANLVPIIKAYLGNYTESDVRVATDVAQLYLEIKKLAELNKLADGANQKPHFSLRTLTRTLVYIRDIAPMYGLRRAVFEGFSMSFLTSLNEESRSILQSLLDSHTWGSQKNRKAVMKQNPRIPDSGKRYVRFRHYWVAQGSCAVEEQPHYIITLFVEQNLLNLVRATSTRRFPVLLQGPTSSGKTSMIEYLARISGNHFVRLNNHEHTDLQEYLGIYVSNPDGRLEYQDGVLVKALKEGHWIVLDELNLAPTEVLEALNRLLDDNRQLLIPETQQTIRPHDNFMLFATQNPPGMYSGRKTLSRAFRNRFVELHFDDIPDDELETILRERSQIAPSFCARIVAVYKELAILRQTQRLFEQRSSFATLRDLFRWALRDADDREQLAINGFMLLAERVRNESERAAVKNVIQEVMKVMIDEDQIYSSESLQRTSLSASELPQGVIWTRSMRRTYVLVTQALKNKEPVLLVGETGSGKTTICQVIAEAMKSQLHIVNAHQNMETSDLIGAQRPLRNRTEAEAQYIEMLRDALKVCGAYKDEYAKNVQTLTEVYSDLLQRKSPALTPQIRICIEQCRARVNALFEWSDGTLVTAMKNGHQFLLDEISLADDSVLERLNSLFEPGRLLYLAEKGSVDAMVTASDGFQFLATMNPGGDYGKRELSPALRNRFTEIWVPLLSDEDEVLEIVAAKLHPMHKTIAKQMVEFAAWFTATYESSAYNLSLRDLISWITFVNGFGKVDSLFAVLHGACMVYLDRLGASPAAKAFVSEANVLGERQLCISKMEEIFGDKITSLYNTKPKLVLDEGQLSIGSFQLPKWSTMECNSRYSLRAPTTLNNAMKILRALRSRKPILLEGSPGVGKTTLVATLAESAGVPLTRINLSDQTDLMDLFGSDVPIEGAEAGHFGWRDAPFLRAMQNGEWVLLDEMNLASQAVLEGLNACFDHRGTIYVPELDQTFSRHPHFVVFAAQNPHQQGGGRRGLPSSFVNRFIVVYADTFTTEDLQIICNEAFPHSDREIKEKVIQCVTDISLSLQQCPDFDTQGGPWEVNLRDALRWLDLIQSPRRSLSTNHPTDYQQLLFTQRFRMPQDRLAIAQIIQKQFADNFQNRSYFAGKNSNYVEVGLGLLPRVHLSRPMSIQTSERPQLNLPIAESLMLCIEQNWPILLVGASGSGKTNMILHLSSLAGAEVVELCLNPDMDTTDLVGGFEQFEPTRHFTNFASRLHEYTQRTILQQLASGIVVDISLLSLESNLRTSITSANILPSLQSLAQSNNSSQYPALLAEYKTLTEHTAMKNRACFEWVDTVLVRAMKQGKWLILDNANLCNPSVLDRLNSLLEPEGFLSINEHRKADGSAHIVKPHPNFRLFMTMDPRHGELSRAMRNRSVELYMPAQSLSTTCDVLDPAIESTISHFALFQTINWNEISNTHLIYLMAICFDHLTFQDLGLLQRWQAQILKGASNLPEPLQEYLQSIVKIYSQLCSSDGATMQAIRYTYALVLENIATPANIGALQTIHPYNNPILLTLTAHNPFFTNLQGLGQSFELLVDIYTFCQELARIADAARVKPVSHMSRLERSFASSGTRTFQSDSTRPLANFLQDMGLFLQYVVDDKDFGNAEDRLDTLSYARDVLNYLNDVLSLAQSPEFEESTFQVYQNLGTTLVAQRKWLKEYPARLADELARRLNTFSATWQLYSGSRMEALWRVFKPSTAQTRAQLDSSLMIEKLADGFDELKWNSGASITELTNLHTLIIGARRIVEGTQGPLKDFLGAEKALESFEGRRLPTSAIHKPYFAEQFDGLHQYEVYQLGDLNSGLAALSGKSTRSYLSPGGPSEGYSSLNGLPHVLGIDEGQNEMAIVRQILPISTLYRLEKMSEVPLRLLDLLMNEIQLLAKSTARLSISLTCHPLKHMIDALQNFHDRLSGILQESVTTEDLQQMKHYLDLLPYRLNGKAIKPGTLEQRTPGEVARSEHMYKSVQYATTPPGKIMNTNMERQPEAVRQMARYMIQLFTGCLLLYIPDRPFDPALTCKVACDRHNKRRTDLRTKLGALRHFEKIISDQSTSYRIKLAEQDLQALGDMPASEPILRPEASKFGELQGEFHNILRTIVLLSPELQMLEAAFAGNETEQSEIELRRRNIATAISRLKQDYQAYDDILKPLVALLQGLDAGLALALLAASKSTVIDVTIERISSITLFMGWTRPDLSAVRLVDVQGHNTQVPDTRVHFLRTAALVKDVEEEIPPAMVQAISHVFHTFYQDWKEQLHQDQQEHAAKMSMYRYQADEEDSDRADERVFHQLFPDYEHTQEDADDESRLTNPDPLKRARQLADLQREVLERPGGLTEKVVALLKNASKDIAHLWSQQSSRRTSPVSTEDMLSALFISLDEHNEALQSTSDVPKTYDFYTDANIFEAQKLVTLICEIQTRFLDLQKTWPEHATLGDVLRVCTELLAMRCTEPVARLLTKSEQLHTFIYEWQAVASREYSTAIQYDQLTQLLISWRRLELSTWAKLLDSEDERCKENADSWWFIAYETIIAAPLSTLELPENVQRYTQQLFSTLEEFLANTSIGQYSQRLAMIRTFQKHVALLAAQHPCLSVVRNTLSNFLGYYVRFEPTVHERLQRGRQVLEKEIKEIVLLASWKDTNINALRDSAKRSHHKLFKVVRKYRALLTQAVGNIITGPIPYGEGVKVIGVQSANHSDVADADPRASALCQQYFEGWSSRPARLLHPAATAQRMLHMNLYPSMVIDGAVSLNTYAENLRGNVRALQEETQSSASGKNKDALNHLKVRKRKLFADTLRDLRQMGFRSNVSADVLAQQASTAVVLSRASSLGDFASQPELLSADLELQSLLNIMPQARECLRCYHEELSHGELARSVGYLESILATLLTQRASLNSAAYELAGLEETRRKLANSWAPDEYQLEIIGNSHTLLDSIVRKIRWLPTILDTGAMITEKYTKLGGTDCSTILNAIHYQKSCFAEINEKLKTLPDLPTGLTSSLHAKEYAKADSAINDLGKQLGTWRKEHPHLAFVLKQIEPWATIMEDSGSQHANGVTSVDLHQFDNAISRALDSMLAAIQDMQRTSASRPSSDEDPRWLVCLEAHLAHSIQKLHIDSITTMLNEALGQIHCLNAIDAGGLNSAGALCAMALPIVQQYHNIGKTSMKQYASLHLSLCKLGNVLSKSLVQIGKEGFCSPTESSTIETGQAEKLGGGTGLGEGEGTEDISKDIQDDEDLSELAQQGQKERHDDSIKDQEGAINMDHDEMEGEVGDASDEGESAGSGSDSGGYDIEDQTGDVDVLDPTAVDEKLWNGEEDDTQRDIRGAKGKLMPSKDEQHITGSDEQKEVAEEGVDDDDEANASQQGAEEGEAVQRAETETADPHAQEGEHLDLPEEIDLDHRDVTAFESDSDVDEINRLSDIEDVIGHEEGDVGKDGDDDVSEEERDLGSNDSEKLQDIDGDEALTKADSPVNDELDKVNEGNDDIQLQDRTDDATVDPDDVAPSEVRGFGQDYNQQNQEDIKQDHSAHGESGDKSDCLSQPSKLSTKGQGEPGEASGQAEALRADDKSTVHNVERQAFKMLGDALERWHRQQRRLLGSAERSQEAEQKPIDVDMHSADLEHLPEGSGEDDGQALGPASNEQAQALDERALASEAKPDNRSFPPDEAHEEGTSCADEVMEDIANTNEPSDHNGDISRPGTAVVSSMYENPTSGAPDTSRVGRREDIDSLEQHLSITLLRIDDVATTRSLDEARQLWAYYEGEMRDQSLYLTEQLRLILAPTVATRMRGDFRTGKRLNMRRIIPYIASQYKRDKIWMRRSIPSKRNYQIMLAVDDSKSMGESGSGQLAFKTLALVAKSLSMLEVGGICVVGFGEEVVVAHAFDKPFSTEAGASILTNFGFQQSKTNVRKLIAESIILFREARRKSSNAGADLWQLELIISDGVCEDHDSIRCLVRQAQEERIMIVFVIIDALHSGESIMDMRQAVFEPDASGDHKLKIKRYLDGFPFLYYLVVGNVQELPGVLAQALRQWFSEVVDSG